LGERAQDLFAASRFMDYSVKEIFYTLQGEGANVGRPAVFCRFSGCNLWSGRDTDRTSANCNFCDTDFVGTNGPGGGVFQSPYALVDAITGMWPTSAAKRARPFVVFTGGEPLLQLNQPVVDVLHHRGFEVAIETNGTLLPPAGIDWICVSPKAGADLVLRHGHELKLVFPQAELPPARFETPAPIQRHPPAVEPFEGLDFQYFYLQPLHGPEFACNVLLAIEYCLEHPQWRLSVQTHKLLRIR
jgi:7-carboxy-7-deazaguanine synthase